MQPPYVYLHPRPTKDQTMPVYAEARQQAEPLSDAEIDQLWDEVMRQAASSYQVVRPFARAVLAAKGSKA